MKLKKYLILPLLIAILTLSISFGINTVYATDATNNPLYLGITEMDLENNIGYSIGNPSSGGLTSNAAKIWNIVKYSTKDSNDPTEADIYCLKAGIGFQSVGQRATYDVFYDMKTQKDAIKAQNEILQKMVDGKIQKTDGTTINQYSAILAVLDMFYYRETSTQEEREALLDEALVTTKNYQYKLTDNDIEAIQQSALWYFTNYGEENGKYDKTGANNSGWLHYTTDGTTYFPLSDFDLGTGAGRQRLAQAEELYKYFINTAIEKAPSYDNISTQTNPPAKVNTAKLNSEITDNKYILGPINISETQGNTIEYNIDLTLKFGDTEISDYVLLDENKQEVQEGTTIKDLVGKDFYISIPYDNAVKLEPHGKGDINDDGVVDQTDLELSLNYVGRADGLEADELERADINGDEKVDLVDLMMLLNHVGGKSPLDGEISIDININYANSKFTLWASNKNDQEQPVVIPEKENISIPTTLTTEDSFDLALRKYITAINDVELTDQNIRIPEIDESTLQTGTTATYNHKKDPVVIETGDIVTYNITVYNEGEKEGRATKVIDQLPEGLKFTEVVSGNFELGSYDEVTNKLTLNRKAGNTENLSAYTQGNLDSETIQIKCEVTATPDNQNSKVLTNVAWIAEEFDAVDNITITNQEGADRDSTPSIAPDVNKDNMADYTGNGNKEDLSDPNYYYKGQEEDDDFEKLVILPETFDLKLIKRIVAVNDQNVPERIESIDVSNLNKTDANGNIIATTAEYNVNKEPVGVKKGDIITYTFRVYNEGTINGYAQEISEDIPEGLEFLWSEKTDDELQADETLTQEEKDAIEFNQNYLWGNFVYDDAGEKIIQISTDYLSKENEGTPGSNLINAFGKNDGTKTENDLSYKEVSVKLRVLADNIAGTEIRNEAAITEDSDEEGNPVDDRDSNTEDWKEHPNHEDDEDHDYIVLQSFDLALRKFVIAVSHDETIDDSEYLKNQDGSYTRAPIVDTSKLNTEDENGQLITTAIYNQTKEPVLVQQNDIVIYMLRVYNEGDIDGYAGEIKDHLPPYLEYVESDFNNQYGWEVSEDGRTLTTRYLEDTMINSAQTNEEGQIVLSYQEVPVMCKIVESAPTSQKLTNIAEISEYLDNNKEETTDRDSQSDNVNLPNDEELPGYKDDETGSYIPGQQDDDDFEKVIIKVFDLSLRKWVTQAIVIENGQQTVTETGHQPYDDPEEIVKVELHRKHINDVVVKFRYKIRVTNEGDVEGYAKEITDYVPQGLKFVAEDNPGWTDEGNNVISTRLLENTLLQPGEYAEVEVVLTWINSEDNMGVMTNTAEISEDDNEYDLPDKDSTPDNQKPGEDDIDDAPVMLSVSTGKAVTYFALGGLILVTIAGGIILIKKFVI